jgi:Laminin B (Domain IV)
MKNLIVVTVLSVFTCQTAVSLESNFDSGDDGWTVGDFFGGDHGFLPNHVTFGGVSGGYIETDDFYGFNAFRAPASWLGDQSGLYGAVLHIHQKVLSSDGLNFPMVALVSGVIKLQYRTPPPGADWTAFHIPLRADEGWEIGNGSGNPGAPATEEDLRRVLSNLSWFAINADWQTGDDLVGMDQVSVSVPEPASFALSASAFAAFAILRRRKHSNKV